VPGQGVSHESMSAGEAADVRWARLALRSVMTSNGEVEGPRADVPGATRAQNNRPRSRRALAGASRTPPTIVRSHGRAGISTLVVDLGGVHSTTVAGLHDKVAIGTVKVSV